MVVPSKSFTVIPDGDIDPDSPLTTNLATSWRDNDIHVEEWLGDSFVAAKDHDHDGINSAIVAGASSALRLVEHKEPTSAVSSVTFSSLDGNTDFHYLLKYKVFGDASAVNLRLQLNTTLPGYVGMQQISSGRSTITAAGSLMNIAIASAVAFGVVDFEVAEDVQSISTVRGYTHRSFTNAGAINRLEVGGGTIADTVANVTSIIIEVTAGNIDVGSYLSLYKIITA